MLYTKRGWKGICWKGRSFNDLRRVGFLLTLRLCRQVSGIPEAVSA